MTRSAKRRPTEASAYRFEPAEHEQALTEILRDVFLQPPRALTGQALQVILRQHPKPGGGFYSKAQLIQGYRFLQSRKVFSDRERYTESELLERIRMKPVRSQSGVTPVTVLTRPHPCPGRCIFCPSDVRMPKSYLSDEPGAQRAAEHQFDPYRQTWSRLLSFHATGHPTDKIELIVLGGTWSFYPEPFQIWFTKRLFQALNDFGEVRERALKDGRLTMPEAEATAAPVDYSEVVTQLVGEPVEGERVARHEINYNRVIDRQLRSDERRRLGQETEVATWEQLEAEHAKNVHAGCRSVGLVFETRPDALDEAELLRLRRLGATKIQIGFQSLDDEVLALNKRGHDTAATRRAMKLLRAAGFKIHAHWMPNLYGSCVEKDQQDYLRMFEDKAYRPDELKVYPCSLIESAELMAYYRDGRWRAYDHDELLEVVSYCLTNTPEYCRLTRVIRDIPGTDIVVGNKLTNFRQVAEGEAQLRGLSCRDIRAREVRGTPVDPDQLELKDFEYESSTGREHFLQWVTPDDRLAGFLRLALPEHALSLPGFEDLDHAAIIREVHVYGVTLGLGERRSGPAQHAGLGRKLVEHAVSLARDAGYQRVAVISAVGTRDYYQGLGFDQGTLYQVRVVTEPVT